MIDYSCRHPGRRGVESSYCRTEYNSCREIEDKVFSDIVDYFNKGDCLVVNESRVFPARLIGKKEKTNAQIVS